MRGDVVEILGAKEEVSVADEGKMKYKNALLNLHVYYL
jgi:hypothetical protein